MVKATVESFISRAMTIKPVAGKRRGFIPGDKVKVEITGTIKLVDDDNTIHIMPDWEGQKVKCGYERYDHNSTDRQRRFFFAFLGAHIDQLRDRGYFSVDDLYHALKLRIQRESPIWRQFEDSDEFSIKELRKTEEFSEFIEYVNTFLTVEMGIDTFEFWREYTTEYEDMGYKR